MLTPGRDCGLLAMPSPFTPAYTASIALALLVSTAAWAGGNPADGHTHDHGGTPYGRPGVAAQVTRTVAVDAADSMRFTPSEIRVKKGETIRFVITNSGKLRHEFSLGTRKELRAHYALMKKFPDMVHEEANKISLEPGASGEVLWQFTQTGSVDFACLQVGHFDAGMKGQVKVAP